MKAAILVVAISFIGCTDLGEPRTDEISNYTGTIVEKNAGQFYLIESDVQFGKRIFLPTNLSVFLRRDGLRVCFGGTIDHDPFIDYIYPLIRLSYIYTLE